MKTPKIPTSDELMKFLISANRSGFAGGDEKKWARETDGSTTINYQEGDFRMQDNYFGGEPYGGRLAVFYKNQPVWMMVYYGYVTDGTESGPVYEVLKQALLNMPPEAPLRGPTKYSHGDYIYMNTWTGEVDSYSGEEQILKMGKVLYRANYLGGWVDVKS